MFVGSCLLFDATGVEAQKPKVVVMDFAGKGGAAARVQVLRALRGKVAFSKRAWGRKVLAYQGARISDPVGRYKIAQELPVDYVVWGRVRGRGASARTEIRVAGKNGQQVSAFEAGRPGKRDRNETIRQAAVAALEEAIKESPPERRAAAKQDDELETRKPDADNADDDGHPEKSTTAHPRSGEAINAPVFTILAGPGGRVRNIAIDLNDGAGGTATRKFESGVYFDIVLRLELRPLARSEKKALRGLALEADAGFGIGLKAQVPGSTDKFDTKTWRLLAQLGYFHGFAKSEIGGLVGIGVDAFDIDDNATLSSTRYLFLRLGPAFRHFFIERTLYLRLDAGFRFPFSYGELADTFGDAKGIGFDAGLMLGGQLDVGLSYAFRVSLDLFKPKFSAFPGGMVPDLPGAAQGSEGTDRALNFNAMVGWAF